MKFTILRDDIQPNEFKVKQSTDGVLQLMIAQKRLEWSNRVLGHRYNLNLEQEEKLRSILNTRRLQRIAEGI